MAGRRHRVKKKNGEGHVVYPKRWGDTSKVGNSKAKLEYTWDFLPQIHTACSVQDCKMTKQLELGLRTGNSVEKRLSSSAGDTRNAHLSNETLMFRVYRGSRWWFPIFYVNPYLGKWSNLTSIFFKWVGSTTDQGLYLYNKPYRIYKTRKKDPYKPYTPISYILITKHEISASHHQTTSVSMAGSPRVPSFWSLGRWDVEQPACSVQEESWMPWVLLLLMFLIYWIAIRKGNPQKFKEIQVGEFL